MATKPFVSFSGNIVEDVNLKKTNNGKSVLNLRLIYTPRKPDGNGGFKDGDSIAMNAVLFNRLADNAAATFTKGMAAHVTGTLMDDSYTNSEGKRVSQVAILADTISADLTFATAQVTRNGKKSS